MEKIRQYLPFILWSISTVFITGFLFVLLIILLWMEKVNLKGRKALANSVSREVTAVQYPIYIED